VLLLALRQRRRPESNRCQRLCRPTVRRPSGSIERFSSVPRCAQLRSNHLRSRQTRRQSPLTPSCRLAWIGTATSSPPLFDGCRRGTVSHRAPPSACPSSRAVAAVDCTVAIASRRGRGVLVLRGWWSESSSDARPMPVVSVRPLGAGFNGPAYRSSLQRSGWGALPKGCPNTRVAASALTDLQSGVR
jgi:hypothetical protein